MTVKVVQITEEQDEALAGIGDELCQGLAKVVAVIMAKFPPELDDEIILRLQDATSLYSPYTYDLTQEIVAKIRAQNIF